MLVDAFSKAKNVAAQGRHLLSERICTYIGTSMYFYVHMSWRLLSYPYNTGLRQRLNRQCGLIISRRPRLRNLHVILRVLKRRLGAGRMYINLSLQRLRKPEQHGFSYQNLLRSARENGNRLNGD